jgi:hypothetical protein
MSDNATNRKLRDLGVDAEVGHRLIEVKIGVSGLRSVRLALMQLAYALAEQPQSEGYLVLSQIAITRERLLKEWKYASAVLRRETLDRMVLCIEENGQFDGIPHTPDLETQRVLLQVLEKERAQAGPRVARADASFVVLKILLYHWLTDGHFVTADWLARTSGYTYPTVANVLQGLGSLIERGSDRRFRLRWFPHEELVRLVSMSDRDRATARYADRSGQPRSPEAHLARLEKLNLPGLAIGGVLGAKHYFPDLDLVGTPRLDISLHARNPRVDLDFIEKLDPALQRVKDPLEPASVVVHNVYHANPLFVPRKGGLEWADPVECLLDLHEARLEKQAAQFLDALRKRRPVKS